MSDKELHWFRQLQRRQQCNCVEVAFRPGGVAVRDTKDRTRPPHR